MEDFGEKRWQLKKAELTRQGELTALPLTGCLLGVSRLTKKNQSLISVHFGLNIVRE